MFWFFGQAGPGSLQDLHIDRVAKRLGIVILNWRNEHDTLRCVGALRSWKALQPKLFVVDNESTKFSKGILAAVLQTGLIKSEINLGFGGGNNLGITSALAERTDYLLLLNSDVVITEGAVDRLLQRLEATPAISILGPVIYERQEGELVCLIGGRDIAFNKTTRISADPHALSEVPGYPLVDVDYVPGAVFLTRGSVFKQIGLLDEKFFFSGETADFCKRARDGGHRVCVDLEIDAEHDTDRQSVQVRETPVAGRPKQMSGL